MSVTQAQPVAESEITISVVISVMHTLQGLIIRLKNYLYTQRVVEVSRLRVPTPGNANPANTQASCANVCFNASAN